MSRQSPDTTLSDLFASHVAGFSWDGMDAAARAATKTFLLDSIGVGLAGSRSETVAPLVATARTWGTEPEARVWNSGTRVPVAAAAMANGYQIHCLEFDCVHEAAVVHPMATILATAMAYAEAASGQGQPVAGSTFGAALAAGVDIAACLGAASTGPITFFRPATAGGFGAAAALAVMEGLPAPAIRDLFGITFSQTCGTMQAHVEGSVMLGLQIGFNARAALCALDLVRAGLSGPRGAFDGPFGYFEVMERGAYDRGWIEAHLGHGCQITQLSHKPYPSGRLTHGVVDAIDRLERDHGIAAREIAHIVCRVPQLAYRLVGRPDVPAPSANYAKLCQAFIGGVRLARGGVGIADFADAAMLEDPAVHAAAARITVVQDDNPDPNAISPQSFDFTLADGRAVTVDVPYIFGHPQNPLSPAQNEAKFRACAAAAARPLPPAQMEELMSAIAGLEDLPDVAILARLTLA